MRSLSSSVPSTTYLSLHGELLAALLRLSRFVAHALEQARDLLVLHETGDLRGRALSGLCEAVHLRQLLLEFSELRHGHLLGRIWVGISGPAVAESPSET